jgi:hypothetical protein
VPLRKSKIRNFVMVNPQISLVYQSANCKSANFSPLDSQDDAPFLKIKSLLDNFMAKTA